jgi:hypothetical protein
LSFIKCFKSFSHFLKLGISFLSECWEVFILVTSPISMYGLQMFLPLVFLFSTCPVCQHYLLGWCFGC